MPEWVRVRDKSTGHEYSVRYVDEDSHDLIDKPAADANRRPLPAKPRLTANSGSDKPRRKAAATRNGDTE